MASKAPDWRPNAACADLGPEIFYRAGYTRDHLAEAEEVCNRCPVLGACLAEELNGPRIARTIDEIVWEQHGFRGGLSASQRRRIVDVGLNDSEIEWVAESEDPRPMLIQMSKDLRHEKRRGLRRT